jgi:hypothetical protein
MRSPPVAKVLNAAERKIAEAGCFMHFLTSTSQTSFLKPSTHTHTVRVNIYIVTLEITLISHGQRAPDAFSKR